MIRQNRATMTISKKDIELFFRVKILHKNNMIVARIREGGALLIQRYINAKGKLKMGIALYRGRNIKKFGKIFVINATINREAILTTAKCWPDKAKL